MTNIIPELTLDGGTPFDDMDIIDGGTADTVGPVFDGGAP